MLEKFKVYIINLKHSRERRESILREVSKQNIKNFKLIEAIDGNKLNTEELNSYTYKNKKNHNPWGPKLTNSQIEFNEYLKNRLKDMYINRDQNKYNDLAEQNYKILIVKNTISNLGSATNAMINKNFK